MAAKENLITFVTGISNGPRIAALERNGKVQIWEIEKNERISRFDTIIERVSHRIAISPDGKLLAVGAYSQNGVSLYDTNTGRELWNRSDLNQVQKVRFSPSGDTVVAAFNEHQATFLDCKNGRSERLSWFKKRISGIRDVYESPFNSMFVHEQWDDDLQITTTEHIPLNSIPRKTFGVLDYAFSLDQLTISESTGPVTCYNMLSGQELWEFAPGNGVHGLCISFVPELNAYATIAWPYEDGGDHALYLLDRPNGNQLNQHGVPNGAPAFIRDGKQMLFSDGTIINTLNGDTHHSIEFMADIR